MPSSNLKPALANRWDEETDANFETTLGEHAEILPVLEANSYESLNGISDSGVAYTRIACYTGEAEDKALVYRVGLKLAGWEVRLENNGSYYEGYIRVAFDTLIILRLLGYAKTGNV